MLPSRYFDTTSAASERLIPVNSISIPNLLDNILSASFECLWSTRDPKGGSAVHAEIFLRVPRPKLWGCVKVLPEKYAPDFMFGQDIRSPACEEEKL